MTSPTCTTDAHGLRIAIVTHTALPTVGGAEVGIHEVARRLGARHDVYVVAAHRNIGSAEDGCAPDPSDRYQATETVLFPHLPRGGICNRIARRTGVAQAVGLLRLHRSLGPTRGLDVINCHFLKCNLLSILLTRFYLRRPIVISLVGRSDVFGAKTRAQRALSSLALRLADSVTTITPYCLRGTGWERHADIIPYGVDVAAFAQPTARNMARDRLGVEESTYVIVAVQRLAPAKRLDLLLRSVAVVRAHVPSVHLAIVGIGPEGPALRALTSALGLTGNVSFLGFVPGPELPSVYAAADVFATHSESETFGIMFAEAMAASLPIVAADTSCVRDVLAPDASVLVPRGDLRAFSEALAALATDPERRASMGERARRHASVHFEWSSIASRYDEVFQRAVRPRDAAGLRATTSRIAE
jgi:glycosyltransferase involved in cell wall biosynthesis